MTSKSTKQAALANNWFNSSKFGAEKDMCGGIKAPPGFGKTRIVLEHIAPKINDAIVIVPRAILKTQWIKRLAEFKISNVAVYTVQQLIANKLKLATNTLIVDEVHLMYRTGDGGFVEYINGTNVKFDNYLWLSATPYDVNGRHDEILKFAPIVGEVTREEASDNNWIAEFTVFNLELRLNNEDFTKYMDLSNKLTEELSKFGKRGYYLVQKCISGGKGDNGKYYPGIAWATAFARENGWSKHNSVEANEMWNPGKIIGYAMRVQEITNARKRFLYEHPDKANAVVEIIKNNDTLKSVSFSKSVQFCDYLVHVARNEGLRAVSLHSKIESQPIKRGGDYIRYKSGKKAGQPRIFGKKKLTEFILDQYRTGHIDLLSSGSSLDTGFDDASIRLGFNSSYTSNPHTLEQILGRVSRFTSIEEPVLFVNIYFQHTVEERWLKNALGNLEKKDVYWVNNVDDITFEVDDNYFMK